MFLDGQKLHPYIPMAKARGFTGAGDKKNKKYKGAIMDKKYLNNVLGVLKEVEYAGDYEEPDYDWDEEPIEGIHYACCPVCGSVLYGENDHYHEEDCRLYKLIKQTEIMLK